MQGLHRFLKRIKLYRYFIVWTKYVVPPGFAPLPLYTVAIFFIKEIQKESLVNKASSLSYNFMMAIFPSIIFLFTLIPYIPIKNFQNQLMTFIALLLPENAYLAFETTFEDIVKNQHTLMQAFNKSSLITETRSFLKQRIVALNLTLLTAFGLILGVGVMVIGEFIINGVKSTLKFNDSNFWIYLIAVIRWFIIIGVYFVTISILYRYGPANPKRWKMFSPGAWFATILAILTSIGFSFYINNFSNYNKLYGSIGTLLVIMIWLYLNSIIILLGFELNASIDLSKRSIVLEKPVSVNEFKKI